MIKKMKRAILSLSVQRKVLLYFIGIALVTILLRQLPFSIGQKAIIQKSVEQSQATINQLSMNIEHNVRLISEKLSVLANDMYVQEQLKRDKELPYDYMSIPQKETMSKIMVQTFYSPIVRDMNIYASNGYVYYITSAKPDNRDYSEYLEKAKEAKGKIVIINEDGEDSDIQIVKAIYDTTTIEFLGVLRVGVKKAMLVETVDELKAETNIDVVLLDENNQAIVGEESNLAADIIAKMTEESGYFRCKSNGTDCYILYQRSEYTNWLTVGAVQLSSYMNATKQLTLMNAITGLAIFIFCTLLSLVFKSFIVDPINEMLNVVNHVSEGDFSVGVHNLNRTDEIGKLSIGINTMITKLDSLITDVYRGELLKKESEFKALQAQINPHFLYNTLDTINWLARKEGMDTICSMVQAVGNLMRISISNKNNIITVQDELKYVEDYLLIQKMRYRDRIEVKINVDSRLLGLRIPKLILQPIVENAVVHGIESSRKLCTMTVEGVIAGECALFIVEDTGVGMTQEQIDVALGRVPAVDDKAGHTSMGIITVQRRIQYLFGDQYGLTIESEEQAWTRVTIRIPIDSVAINDNYPKE